jgi:site-specific recombinase XerD
MSLLAPTLQAFFTERMVTQKNASPRTLVAYRNAFRLLLHFAQQQTGKRPCDLDFADLDAPLIGAFLDHLEHDRGNTPRSRNARLAAIHSLFRYAALRHPEHSASIARVIEIPAKRCEHATVSYLTGDEIQALVAAPDRATWLGRRDHALILLAIQTGLRVSELVALCCKDISTSDGAHVRVRTGKGRKQRCTPLSEETKAVLRTWLAERQGAPEDPLFPSRRGRSLGPDAVAWLLAKHARAAAHDCPSLGRMKVTPHVLRHTSAMMLRAVGVDLSVIALWLGHESIESTQIYLHADLALKEKALALTAPVGTPPGRYRPPDTLLAFLDAL